MTMPVTHICTRARGLRVWCAPAPISTTAAAGRVLPALWQPSSSDHFLPCADLSGQGVDVGEEQLCEIQELLCLCDREWGFVVNRAVSIVFDDLRPVLQLLSQAMLLVEPGDTGLQPYIARRAKIFRRDIKALSRHRSRRVWMTRFKTLTCLQEEVCYTVRCVFGCSCLNTLWVVSQDLDFFEEADFSSEFAQTFPAEDEYGSRVGTSVAPQVDVMQPAGGLASRWIKSSFETVAADLLVLNSLGPAFRAVG